MKQDAAASQLTNVNRRGRLQGNTNLKETFWFINLSRVFNVIHADSDYSCYYW